MKPKPLDTILPTAESLATNDRFHLESFGKARQAAKKIGLMESRFFEGEWRYNETPDEYTIVSLRDFKPRTFVKRADGYYYAKK